MKSSVQQRLVLASLCFVVLAVLAQRAFSNEGVRVVDYLPDKRELILGEPLLGTLTITPPTNGVVGLGYVASIVLYVGSSGQKDKTEWPDAIAVRKPFLKENVWWSGRTLKWDLTDAHKLLGVYRAQADPSVGATGEMEHFLFPEPGTYRLGIEVFAGGGQYRSDTVEINVRAPNAEEEAAWKALPKEAYAILGFHAADCAVQNWYAAARHGRAITNLCSLYSDASVTNSLITMASQLERFMVSFSNSVYTAWVAPGAGAYAALASRAVTNQVGLGADARHVFLALEGRCKPRDEIQGIFALRSGRRPAYLEQHDAFVSNNVTALRVNIRDRDNRKVDGRLLWKMRVGVTQAYPDATSELLTLCGRYAQGKRAVERGTADVLIPVLTGQTYVVSFAPSSADYDTVEVEISASVLTNLDIVVPTDGGR